MNEIQKNRLRELVSSMMEEYREKDSFSPEKRELLLSFSEIADEEISKLIKKFYDINNIVDNGGFPVLKRIFYSL
ncbi:hypothetical protein P9246_10740 [Aeribacillus pallidus]|uniref:hypothetical protein n=1 Tax=Aeribacillus composti TaxID=1868734 RepID=UPI002E24BF23|nr:hypothetical protein [Aeribacillus composti]MED4487217.1 hypothetical protein [Aeribacillus pallidus]